MVSADELKHSIVGLGNPLLDIVADVDEALLQKYDLKLDNAILAEDKHLPLYDELASKYNPKFIAGGATQNGIRVAQWMLKHIQPSATSFFGSVGKDEHAKTLQECAEGDGVRVHYMQQPSAATGTCAVCVKDNERSLVANLSAANMLDPSHLDSDYSKQIISEGKIYYVAGFPLTVTPESVLKIAEHAASNAKVFMMNLAAPFIVSVFKDPLMQVMEYADYVFGNETEAKELGKVQGWGEDLKEIALKASQLPKKSSTRGRTVIFTQGAEQTIVARDGKVETHAVPQMDTSKIIDSNGAGDAFVGGFLSRFALGKSIADCVQAGHWSAQVVITCSGCAFPKECTYKD